MDAAQGLDMLHGCGWAFVNLKEDKVLVTETDDALGQPGLHCTIIDLGAAIQTGKQMLATLHTWICCNSQSNCEAMQHDES